MEEFTEIIEEIKELDNRLKEIYQEIDETIYKGESKDRLVKIDLRGSFVVDRVMILENDYTQEELGNSIKEAFNSALKGIKRERNDAIMQLLYGDIGEL